MPTYDYVCRACEHAFERFQSMSEPQLRKCPECGEKKLERLIGTGAGFLFKGSGYYVTDYRSKGYEEAKKKDAPSSGPEAKDAGKDASKSGSKKESEKKGGGGAGSGQGSSGTSTKD